MSSSAEDGDWRRKLQKSETKRAEMVMENHRLKDEVDQLRVSDAMHRQASASPPGPYATVGGGSASPQRGHVQEAWTPGGASIAGMFASPIHKGGEGSPTADRRVEALEKLLHEKSEQLDVAQRLLGQSSPQNRTHQQHAGHAPSQRHGGVGFVTIAPLPQASEEDYGFAEEDHAKQCAEEIMARLLRALHAQREAQDKLAAAQLANVRLQSLLDESRGREVVLSQMMGAYSEVVNSGGAGAAGSSGGPSSRSRAHGVHADGSSGGGPQQVEAYLQQCVQNLTRLDGVKRRLVDEKLKEVTEECARLKEKRLNSSGGTLAGISGSGHRLLGDVVQSQFGGDFIAAASSTAPARSSATKFGDVTSQHSSDIPLLSDERALLLQLLERDKEYQSRMQKMKDMIIDKEKQNQDLKKLLAVRVANNAPQKRGHY
ncbi:Hypothetical protein, putative [Bodo saltans]|uniref:Uncharacterized protein n=1 Tax=Bodo saltans TaxID=75058 RepID=A0A0S4JUN9_BODSA|nr:Hypothetical protein, putative [Bodo saltans]|eukprot:CUG94129.1 Hypothetical protein, putative [Bodo saltans]